MLSPKVSVEISFKISTMICPLRVCMRRTREGSRITNDVHQNQPKTRKTFHDVRQYNGDINTSADNLAGINSQPHHIFYNRFGRRGSCVDNAYMVINFVTIFVHIKFARTLNEISFKIFLFFLTNERFPFNTKNPVGFLIAVSIQHILVTCLMISVKCVAIFGIGTYSMLFPLISFLKDDLQTANDNARRRRNRSKTFSQISRIVRFHSKLIQLSQTI